MQPKIANKAKADVDAVTHFLKKRNVSINCGFR